MRTSLKLLLAASLALSACGSKQKEPAPAPKSESAAAEERAPAAPAASDDPADGAVAFMVQLAEILRRNPDNCDAAHDETLAFLRNNIEGLKATGAAIAQRTQSMTDDERKAYLETFQQRMKDAAGDYDKLGDEFKQRCPEQDQKLKDVLTQHGI